MSATCRGKNWTRIARWTSAAVVCVLCCVAQGVFAPAASGAEMSRTIIKGEAGIPDETVCLKDVAYVKDAHERQKLDLLIPPSKEKLPLLVWVHGGGWEEGDKGERTFYRFLKQGYAVASINYRLSQDAIYPAQIQDCKSAIRWLRAHADKYGYDSEKIGVGGASAGGHLVLLLGGTGSTREFDVGEYLDQSSAVQVVCDFFGPADFKNYDFEKTIFKRDDPNSCFARLLGGLPDTKMDKVEKASPINFVTPKHPPTIILHGNKDNLVPLDQSERYLKKLAEVEVESSLYIINGAGHGFGGENHWREITTFFARHLKPTKRIGYTELLLEP